MWYYVVLLLLVLLALPSSRTSRCGRESLALLILLFFGGLRYEVGTDWHSYKELFDAVSAGEPFSDFREESGFLFLTRLLTPGDFELFVFALMALALGIKAAAIKLFGAELNIAILVYFSAIFLIYDVNGMRQGLAMGLVLLAGWAAYRSRTLLFIGIIALATSVHFVSVIALPLYGMTRRLFLLHDPWRRLILLCLGATISHLLANAIAGSELSNYFELINLADRYEHYEENFPREFNPLGIGSLQRIILALAVIFLIDSFPAPLKLKSLLYNCHAAALLLYFVLSFNVELMARVSYYYKCFDVITLAMAVSSQRTPEYRGIALLLLTVFTAAQVFQILSIEDGGLLPYRIFAARN